MTKHKTLEQIYEDLGKSGHQSNMRLTVKYSGNGRDYQYAYDIGIKQVDDKFNQLSQMTTDMEPPMPRFVEDFIEVYSKKNVSVHEYGKFLKHKDLVEELLS